jgi:hypothetical protein
MKTKRMINLNEKIDSEISLAVRKLNKELKNSGKAKISVEDYRGELLEQAWCKRVVA